METADRLQQELPWLDLSGPEASGRQSLKCCPQPHGTQIARERTAACRYHQDKGFQVILVSQVLNLLALGFTIAFSALLLLCVRWSAFHAECVEQDTCDISEVNQAITSTLPAL